MRTTMHANRPFATVLLRRRAYGYIVASTAPPLTGGRELLADSGGDLELVADASTDHELL